MKLSLIAMLLVASSCYANVVRGPDKNGRYVVDSCGYQKDSDHSRRDDDGTVRIHTMTPYFSEGLMVKGKIAMF